MKWYSVKEYYPPISTICLIRTEINFYFVARLKNIDTPDTWIYDFYCNECVNRHLREIYGITHFCLIEPVPIFRSDKGIL